MKRKLCVSDNSINMLYAQEADRRYIYERSVQDRQIVLSMLEHPDDFRWEDIRDERAEFFDEQASINKYLLIEYCGEIVGFFYHTRHAAPIDNVEFHVWFVAMNYTGRGLGSRVVTLMKNYIHQAYATTHFIMRPWIRNQRAIRAYEKCGFEVQDNFDINDYFTPKEIARYGNGQYSPEETVNMLAVVNRLKST